MSSRAQSLSSGSRADSIEPQPAPLVQALARHLVPSTRLRDQPADLSAVIDKLRRTARVAESNARWVYLAAGAFHPDGLQRRRDDLGDQQSLGEVYADPLARAARALADLIEWTANRLALVEYKDVLSEVAAAAGLAGRSTITAEDVLTVLASDDADHRKKALRLLPYCPRVRDSQDTKADRPGAAMTR